MLLTFITKTCRRITRTWEENFKRMSRKQTEGHELDLSGSKHGLWQALVKEINKKKK